MIDKSVFRSEAALIEFRRRLDITNAVLTTMHSNWESRSQLTKLDKDQINPNKGAISLITAALALYAAKYFDSIIGSILNFVGVMASLVLISFLFDRLNSELKHRKLSEQEETMKFEWTAAGADSALFYIHKKHAIEGTEIDLEEDSKLSDRRCRSILMHVTGEL